MINYHKQLKQALATATSLPVYYELLLTADTQFPCITYYEVSNIDNRVGDTLRFSDIQYQIKVWGDLETIQSKAQLIDDAVRPLGFRRVGGREMISANPAIIQKVLTYNAIGCEYDLSI